MDAPSRAVDVAERWDVDLHGFHDAGWTSVLAFGTTSGGRAVMLKLVPSRSRFLAELASLTHWTDAHTCAVLRHDRTHHALLLSAVGHQAGGASRPADHQARVAEAMPSLHRSAAPSISVVPDLAESFTRDVEPRLLASHHLPLLSRVAPVEAVISAARAALRKPGKPVMLHADLYESNVLFNGSGNPVFIDPRGLRGPATYDWAFWSAFYSTDRISRPAGPGCDGRRDGSPLGADLGRRRRARRIPPPGGDRRQGRGSTQRRSAP